MAFPKINVGKLTNKVNKFDLSHDASHTADFGFIQPMSCIEFIPEMSAKIHIDSEVTLNPLVVPTKGRISYKTFSTFVPMHDLMENFDSMYAGLPYHSTGSSYTPSSVPTMSPRHIFMYVAAHSYIAAYKTNAEGVYTQIVPSSTPNAEVLNAYCSFFGVLTSIVEGTHLQPNFNLADAPYFKVTLPVSSSVNKECNTILPSGADFVISHEYGDATYLFLIRLNNVGKRVRKALIGLGYNLDPTDDTSRLSLMPIFAYYKAYFDLFNPQRDTTWLNTNVYSFLQKLSATGTFALTPSTFNQDIEELFEALSYTFYVEDNNFVSAHISTPSLYSGTCTISSGASNSLKLNSGVGLQNNGLPRISNISIGSDSDGVTVLSQQRLNILQRLFTFANITTQFGKRLKDLTRELTGSSDVHLPESNFIGYNEMFVNIDPIFSTVESGEDNPLGSFAGRGHSQQRNNDFTYKASTFGYIITMSCVVPHGNFFQGQAGHLYHRTRYEFYNGFIDGVGMEITPKGMIMADNSVARSDKNYSGDSFGFIPRYTTYKTHQGVVNGDLSLRSTRMSLLPYTLDKFITPTDISVQDISANSSGLALLDTVSIPDKTIPIASSQWRYVNRYKWLANYDRIFAENNSAFTTMVSVDDSLITDEPIICNNIVWVEAYAPMLSISDSFETDPFGEHTSVEKA